jgi:DNA-binding CsgD family transcriptional regulator
MRRGQPHELSDRSGPGARPTPRGPSETVARSGPSASPWLECDDAAVRNALEILDVASHAASPNELCLRIADLICRRLGGQQAVVGIQNRLQSSPAFLMFNGEPAYAEQYVEHFHNDDPFDITRYLRGKEPLHSPSTYLSRISSCDLVDYADIMKTEYYVDFCLPQKVHHSLVTRLDGGPSLRATLCIHRSREAGPFSPAAVRMMEALSPHLSANLKRTVDELVVSALEIGDDSALVLLDGKDRIIYSNSLAAALATSLESARGDAEPMGAERLLGLAPAEGQRTVETGDGTYVLAARSLSCSPCRAARAVEIRRVPDFQTLYGDRLRARFGFSQRETEVLVDVIQGRRNKEIARRLFVTEHTVKKHIQNMARKAGADSRTALVHTALQHLGLIP